MIPLPFLAIPNPPVCPNTIINATGTFFFHCVYKYLSPMPLDIRYWWYGFTVMLIIMSAVDGFAVQRGVIVGSTTFIYLTFIGLFIGGIIATIMGIMSWILPFTILILLILYVWRTRS